MKQMQIKNQQISVGQLAKTDFPTLKITKNKALSVGRHQKKQPHTRPPAYASRDTEKKPILMLRKIPESDFLQIIPILFEQLEGLDVVFHNLDYVDAIFETYHKQDAFVLLQWVKTFAILRKDNRPNTDLDNVLQSNEDDFLRAFRLILSQKIKPKKKRELARDRIYKIIIKHFKYEPFETKELYHKVALNRSSISEQLRVLEKEGRLIRCRKKGAHIRYKAIEIDEI